MDVPSVGMIAAAGYEGGKDDDSVDAEYGGSNDAEDVGRNDAACDSRDTMQSHDAQSNGSNSKGSNDGRSDGSSREYHSNVCSHGVGNDCDDNWMKSYLSAHNWGMHYVNSTAGRFWCGVPETGAATRVLRLAHPVCVVQKIRATRGNAVSEYMFGSAGEMYKVATCESGVEESTLCQHPASNCLIVDGAFVVSCNWRFAAVANLLCQKYSACSCTSQSFGCLSRPCHSSCVE